MHQFIRKNIVKCKFEALSYMRITYLEEWNYLTLALLGIQRSRGLKLVAITKLAVHGRRKVINAPCTLDSIYLVPSQLWCSSTSDLIYVRFSVSHTCRMRLLKLSIFSRQEISSIFGAKRWQNNIQKTKQIHDFLLHRTSIDFSCSQQSPSPRLIRIYFVCKMTKVFLNLFLTLVLYPLFAFITIINEIIRGFVSSVLIFSR